MNECLFPSSFFIIYWTCYTLFIDEFSFVYIVHVMSNGLCGMSTL